MNTDNIQADLFQAQNFKKGLFVLSFMPLKNYSVVIDHLSLLNSGDIRARWSHRVSPEGDT